MARVKSACPITTRTAPRLDTMSTNPTDTAELCSGCVYYPPNLPPQAYSAEDWAMLQRLSCAFEHTPGSADCLLVRKTSCSLLDLMNMNK